MTEDTPLILVPQHITTKTTDDRGRITLGAEYANKRIKIAILETTHDGEQ